jgi:hypothetical protein
MPLLLRICHMLLLRCGHDYPKPWYCDIERLLYAYVRDRTIPLPACQPFAAQGIRAVAPALPEAYRHAISRQSTNGEAA